MSTLHTRANWGRDLVPDLRKYVFDGFKMLPDYVSQVFNILATSKAFEEDRSAFGIGQITETSESAPTPESSFQDGFTTRYTPKTFKRKIPVSYELFKDDQYSIFNKRAMSLGRAAMRTINSSAFSIFRNGYDTAYTSYGDSKPLFSTSHTRADGGTAQSNASSTGIPLTETNLFTGIQALRTQLDDVGELISIGDKPLLLIPTALEKAAMQITESELRSGTSDNDTNYYMGKKVNTLVCPWIGAEAGGSDTAWTLISPSDHQLNFMWREKPRTFEWQDEDTDVLYSKLFMRFTYGWSDWRGTWGSKGDSVAYSS